MKITLKGWTAIPAIAVLLIILGVRMASAGSVLDGEQGQMLKSHLRGEYSGIILANHTGSDGKAHYVDPNQIRDLEDIEFSNIGVKGSGGDVVIRIDISVAGKTPPDGKTTRYYELRHNMIGGWRVEREVSSVSYLLKLF